MPPELIRRSSRLPLRKKDPGGAFSAHRAQAGRPSRFRPRRGHAKQRGIPRHICPSSEKIPPRRGGRGGSCHPPTRAAATKARRVCSAAQPGASAGNTRAKQAEPGAGAGRWPSRGQPRLTGKQAHTRPADSLRPGGLTPASRNRRADAPQGLSCCAALRRFAPLQLRRCHTLKTGKCAGGAAQS